MENPRSHSSLPHDHGTSANMQSEDPMMLWVMFHCNCMQSIEPLLQAELPDKVPSKGSSHVMECCVESLAAFTALLTERHPRTPRNACCMLLNREPLHQAESSLSGMTHSHTAWTQEMCHGLSDTTLLHGRFDASKITKQVCQSTVQCA